MDIVIYLESSDKVVLRDIIDICESFIWLWAGVRWAESL